MNLKGKPTKTEWLLLAMAAIFLIGLLATPTEEAVSIGTGVTVITQRQAEEEVTPAAPEDVGPININTAGADDLDTLPGIGPVLAQRIIEYRAAHGPFQKVNDLLEVKGIGPATLDKVRDHVTVGK